MPNIVLPFQRLNDENTDNYAYDFISMKQTNTRTKYKRNI